MTDMDLTALDTSWEECVSAGIVLAQNLDAGRWQLGDLAGTVTTAYGEDSIGAFASEIGMAKAQTLRDYARVARRFPSAIRNAYVDSPLTFSHFRATIRAGEDAELWLARAADEGLTVAELHRQIAAAIGKPVPPKLLYSGRSRVWHENKDYSKVMIPGDVDVTDGQIVTVRVYEAGAE